MRPSLLPGLIAAARRNLDRGAVVGPAVRDRPPLSRRCRASDAVAAPRRRANGRAAGSPARPQAFDAFDAKAEALALLEAAGAPVANLQVLPRRRADLASRPVGQARPRAEDDRRQLRRASSRPRQEPRRARRRGRRAKSISTRFPAARSSGRARAGLCAACAAAGHARLRVHRSGRACRRQPAPRDPRQRQGGDHRRSRLFDRFETADGLSLAVRSHAPAGRQELHRRADRRDLEAHRRRRRKARRAPPELDSSALIAA